MNPRELRIGNIVQSKTGIWMTVTEILSNGITYDRYDMQAVADFCEYEDLKPVALTFSILLDSGFEVLYDNPRLETFLINKSGYYPFLLTMGRSTDEFYFQENTVIKTVHHLQNLFSNITDEELVIKIDQLTAKEAGE